MKTSKADKYFSLFIRLRDSDENGIGKCRMCGRIGEVKYMDNCHFIKRQYAPRYNEMNCAIGCKHCNYFLQGNDVNFRKYLVSVYGEDKIQMLEAEKYKSHKLGAFELTAIADYYKAKVNELMKTKNIEKWW